MDYISHYKFTTNVSLVFLKHLAKLVKGKKVLDLGCGTGKYLEFFGNNSLGIDISPLNLKEAKANKHRVKKGDLNKFNRIDEKFEFCFVSHILEHVERPIDLLKLAHKCLLPGGKIIVCVPNLFSFINIRYPYFTNDGNHLYAFSLKNMFELLKYAGFEVESYYFDYYSSLTNKIRLNGLLQYLNFLPTILKIPFAHAFWLMAKKSTNPRL